MSTPARPVLERPGVRVVRSEARAWEAAPDAPGALRRVLARDGDDPAICLFWYPPGYPGGRRSRHRSASEFAFTLGGELHLREFADEVDERGTLVVHRPGFCLDRQPGSIHGIVGDPSPVGFTVLEWKLRGSLVGIPAAGGMETDAVLDWPGTVRVLDSREAPWWPHPTCAEGRLKPLARDEAGGTTVALVWLPPGAATAPTRGPTDARELCYVLDGDWATLERGTTDEEADRVLLEAGTFVDRAPGAVSVPDPARPSQRGVTALVWRTRDGTFLGQRAAAADTEVVPFG